jgi:hypothetical protein
MNEKVTFNAILVAKLSGPKSEVLKHIDKLKEIYTEDRLNISQLLKNEADGGHHCYVNIMVESTDDRANQS